MTNLWKNLWVHLMVCCGFLQLSVYAQEAVPNTGLEDRDKIDCSIYFYSYENGTNSFKPLKDEFDKYLAGKGGILFQPFEKYDSFNRYVKTKKGSLLLLSSWHYSKIYKAYNLKPLMVGVVKGHKYQNKVLVVKDRSTTLESISKSRITAAGTRENSRLTLATIFKDEKLSQKIRVLSVPKDLDALFSVGYDKAKAALCSRRSFELLKKTYPSMANKLSVIAEGEKSLNMILASTEGETEDVRKTVKVLVRMSKDEAGKSKLKRLGLDGFKPLDDRDLNTLENKKK